VRKYQDRVFNACWRICGHLEDARDLTQEAFLKAYEGLSGFRQQSGFYTWVFRVAVNLALSHRRKVARRREVSFDQSGGSDGSQADGLARHMASGRMDDPARAADEAELQGRVVRALQGLDDDHRAVIVLRDIEGFDYREIGEILEIPPGTVRSRLHRARLALGEAMGKAGRDG
jgi:RNA polymerase sigma-70 factor (ECF subfamily)